MLFISFLFGASLTSFIASYSFRLVNNYPLTIPQRSYCDNCHSFLRWWHLIPIVSFIVLRGQCHYCKQKISLYLPVIELLSGITFAIFFIYEPVHDLIIISFLSSLIFLTYTDFFNHIIYSYSLLGLVPIALLSVPQNYFYNLIFACILAVSLLLFATVTKTLGIGDIEFLFVICLVWGWYQTLLIIQWSSLIMLFAFLFTKKSQLPFIPALAFTTIPCLFIQGC
ncbi:prepilin peptidase [Limosilactobacillus agrestis]|uniref:prepilin peptidase n=1 Tax=Limosilactobacillus agrestis TaxID=2759748 RepID=UPI001E5D9021|nr:A24 family peptidase [Limosilactobacillus agrestis]MCD7113553.1 prepilin peptidase [Limosilactobacillus agrestis]